MRLQVGPLVCKDFGIRIVDFEQVVPHRGLILGQIRVSMRESHNPFEEATQEFSAREEVGEICRREERIGQAITGASK